ncbi:MAG TPA: hypothetical protein VI074_05145 [Propionibacteriaceae bacterium]
MRHRGCRPRDLSPDPLPDQPFVPHRLSAQRHRNLLAVVPLRQQYAVHLDGLSIMKWPRSSSTG